MVRDLLEPFYVPIVLLFKMGNLLGNVLALVVLVASAIAGFVSLLVGSVAFASVAYLAWGILWVIDRSTRPPRDMPLCLRLLPSEVEAYRSYHTFLMAPGAGQMFSAFVNSLRIGGLIWAGVCFWNGLPWAGGAFALYYFLVGGLALRLDPVCYIAREAQKGNHVAMEQWALIESVREKREAYNAEEPEEPTRNQPGKQITSPALQEFERNIANWPEDQARQALKALRAFLAGDRTQWKSLCGDLTVGQLRVLGMAVKKMADESGIDLDDE